MTDTLCLEDTQNRSLDRLVIARCRKAAVYGVEVILSANGGPKGRARGAKYRRSLEEDLYRYLVRIWAGCEEDGHEPHTHYATARGRAQARRMSKSAAHDRSLKFEAGGLIERANAKVRRGELPRKTGAVLIANPLHWVATVWRIGPTLLEFFSDLLDSGTDLAATPRGNQNRTCISPPERDFSQPSEIHPSSLVSTDQIESGEASAFGILSEKGASIGQAYRQMPVVKSPIPRVSLPSASVEPQDVQTVIGATVQASSMTFEPEQRAHPEGRDLGHVMSGSATRGALDRVSRAVTGVEFHVHVRCKEREARYQRGSVPAAPDPTGPDAQPAPVLETACQRLEGLPRRKVSSEPLPAAMPHPMGHNRPPADPSPPRKDLSSDLNPIRDDDGRTEFDRLMIGILAQVRGSGS